jgi:hypothetical protein
MAEPIIRFRADPEVIQSGESATLRWHVENVQAVYLFCEGERWREHGVVGDGELQVSPSDTTTYCLRVHKADDTIEVRKRTIQVQAQAQAIAQTGRRFSADRVEIEPGECVTFRWRADGIKAIYFFAEGERWQDHGVVGEGEQQACPSQTTTYCLRIVNRDDSVDVHQIPIQVVARAELPTFSADRAEVHRGECVNLQWHVEGVKAVYFCMEGENWQDHGVAGEGRQEVCPSQTTTYCLRVIKTDDSVEIHYIGITVKG